MYYLIKIVGMAVYQDTGDRCEFRLVTNLTSPGMVSMWNTDKDYLLKWCILQSENMDELLERATLEAL